MSAKLAQISEKRALLVAECEGQRVLMSQCMMSWRRPLHLADQGLEILRYLRQHPAWLVGTGVMLIALKPARTFRWLKLSWAGWMLIRKLRH